MNMVRLGLRNLFRNLPRLAIVALLIAFPLFLLLVMQAIGTAVEGQTEVLKRNVDNTLQLRARGSMGHVNMTGNEDILPQDVLETVKDIQHVAKAEPYLLAMTPTDGHNFAIVVGVTPTDTKRLESHGEAGNPRMIAGRDLTAADQGQRVAIIGQGYAKWAGITADNLDRATHTLDLTRTHPVIFALNRPPATLKIVGIYASGYVFGDMQLFMPLDTFRDIYRIPQGISWLYVKADSADNLPQVEQKLRAVLGETADIIAPTNVAEFQHTATQAVVRLANGGILLSAFLLAIVVFFVMLLVVRERAWEIGTLKALGASNGGIVIAFLSEAVAFCAIGAALGAAIFGLWGGAVVQRVFGLGVAPFLPAAYKDTLGSALSLSADLGPTAWMLLAAVCLASALAGSAWAMRQIIQLSPTEAMRHE